MAARWTLSPDALQGVKAAMERAPDKTEYRRALCVWLHAGLGFTLSQTARAVGWSVGNVEGVERRYRRRGVDAFQDSRRPPLSPASVEALRAALDGAHTAGELRRLLCLWLRVALGLKQGQIAAALACRLGFVREAQQSGLKARPATSRWGKRPLPEGAAAELRQAVKRARTVPEYRRALCLFMRAVLGLSPTEVSQVVGHTPATVVRLHTQYLRQGAVVLRNRGRGGPRRGLLSQEQERELMRNLRQSCDLGWGTGIVNFAVVHDAVQKLFGRPVNASAVQAILDRHGWSRDALVITPYNLRPRRERTRPSDKFAGYGEPPALTALRPEA